MTTQRSFKRLVRARMEKTGESYTAARARLLAAVPATGADDAEKPPLATSDAAIRERTGHGWEEWFDFLDEWGGTQRPHREIARRVAEELGGIDSLAWNATRPRSARFGHGEGGSRVHVTFVAKGEVKSTAAVEHARLADAQEVERMKGWWRERLGAPAARLEGGRLDA